MSERVPSQPGEAPPSTLTPASEDASQRLIRLWRKMSERVPSQLGVVEEYTYTDYLAKRIFIKRLDIVKTTAPMTISAQI